MLGNCRVEAFCADSRKHCVILEEKMKKKVWITVGDIVLIGLRDFSR